MLGPQERRPAGAAHQRSSTRPRTRSTDNGDSFRGACANCRRPRAASVIRVSDLFGTIRQPAGAGERVWPTATSRSCSSPTTSRVGVAGAGRQFHRISTAALGALNQVALATSRASSTRTTTTLIGQVAQAERLHPASCTEHSDDIEQVLHVDARTVWRTSTTSTTRPGHRRRPRCRCPNFANPVQFICGGAFDVGASPGQLQARRDLPPAHGAGVQATIGDELPARSCSTRSTASPPTRARSSTTPRPRRRPAFTCAGNVRQPGTWGHPRPVAPSGRQSQPADPIPAVPGQISPAYSVPLLPLMGATLPGLAPHRPEERGQLR